MLAKILFDASPLPGGDKEKLEIRDYHFSFYWKDRRAYIVVYLRSIDSKALHSMLKNTSSVIRIFEATNFMFPFRDCARQSPFFNSFEAEMLDKSLMIFRKNIRLEHPTIAECRKVWWILNLADTDFHCLDPLQLWEAFRMLPSDNSARLYLLMWK